MYIQFTKDINKIRNILFLGRTFREICIFTVSGFIAFLSYHITKRILPGTLSLYVIVPTMLVASFFAFYHKNNLKFEKVIFYRIKRVLFGSKIRKYHTENFYESLETLIIKEENLKNAKYQQTQNAISQKSQTVKKHAAQNRSADHTVSGHAPRRYMHGKKRLLH